MATIDFSFSSAALYAAAVSASTLMVISSVGMLRKVRLLRAEGYFSTALYFRPEVPDANTDAFLAKKDTLVALYGPTDVDIMLMFMAMARVDRVVAAKDRVAFDAAIAFAQEAMDEETQAFFLPNFREDFAKAMAE